VKAQSLGRIIKQEGGLFSSLKTLWRTDELKEGKLVGVDKYGNKYYENDKYMFARNRWVVYAGHFGLDYNASQVPPEWHRWLHHIGDNAPTVEPFERKRWEIDHEENLTGTAGIYVPYSTTRPKVEAWRPAKPANAAPK